MIGLAAVVAGQYALGVTTLLLVVPVQVAILHQIGAVTLLTVMLAVVHRLSGPERVSRRHTRDTEAFGAASLMIAQSAVSLEAVFGAIPVGLGVVDLAQRIVLMNQAFRESLGLPFDAFPPGTPVVEAVRASALRGVYGPGDPEAQVKAVMAPDRRQAGRLRRRTFEGRSFDLYNTPLPDGSYIVSAIETTAPGRGPRRC